MPSQHKQAAVSLRLGPVRDRLLAYAARTGRAVNAVIRDAITEYLDKHDEPEQP